MGQGRRHDTSGGIPFNVAFAKALTWRLGSWFGVLSAIGDDGDTRDAVSTSTMELVRTLFPSTGTVFSFKAPDRDVFVELISSVDGLTREEVKRRAANALRALRGEGE